MWPSYLKPVFDRVCGCVGLIIFSPFMIFLAFLVRINLGTPVLFRQERTGLRGSSFVMVKFRSMTGLRDKQGVLLGDAERMTKFGTWLRRTSLDELPELWNVLCGQMSLIGPRPLLPEYLPLYSERQKRRHDVKPGLTGWAQVNGRNAISWDERLELDVWYVENQSLRLDISILCRTIRMVLKSEGVSANGHATMERFTGSNSSSGGPQ